MSPFNSSWLQLCWSEWLDPVLISSKSGKKGTVESCPGVYRIRVNDCPIMAYIGESKSLSSRIIGTWTRVNSVDAPDVLGQDCKLWELARLREQTGCEYRISWATSSCNGIHDLKDKRVRKALERYLTWQYRLSERRSALANHGRANSEAPTCKAPVAAEGGEVPDSLHPRDTTIHVSTRPLELESEPLQNDWMGLRWTDFITQNQAGHTNPSAFDEKHMACGPALYKILSSDLEQVLMVGGVQSAEEGVRKKLKELPGYPVGAWAPLRRAIFKYERREMRDDLIGAYYYKNGCPPRYQFTSEYEVP